MDDAVHYQPCWLACAALGLFFLLRFCPGEPVDLLPPLQCHHCGGDMKLLGVTFVNCAFLLTHGQQVLDSR